MAFSAKDVQRLREMTGVGMMDCKKALTDAEGDFDRAVEILREKGQAAAVKKAGRIAAEGVVLAKVCDACGAGVIVEINSETDFVAKNASFQQFADDVATTVLKARPADVDALMTADCADTGMTVDAALKDKILTIGENIKIRRFDVIDGGDDVMNVSYVHMGGKIGVLVSLKLDGICKCTAKDALTELGKDLAMQTAAMNPPYLNRAAVPADVLAQEKEIQLAQMANDPKMANKPDKVKEGIVMGKMGKYYEENCLVEQAFVKENKVSVQAHVDAVAKELGGKIEVVKFIRFEKGEGLAKREENFAEEIAKQLGK